MSIRTAINGWVYRTIMNKNTRRVRNNNDYTLIQLMLIVYNRQNRDQYKPHSFSCHSHLWNYCSRQAYCPHLVGKFLTSCHLNRINSVVLFSVALCGQQTKSPHLSPCIALTILRGEALCTFTSHPIKLIVLNQRKHNTAWISSFPRRHKKRKGDGGLD